jgi:(E)-4-hydroxy-3-methyl-but-2-enyl pyrophosphate reductase
VVEFLEKKGVRALPDDLKSLKRADLTGKHVVIRSHGVPPSVQELLLSRGAVIIDATCPIVKKAQKAARNLVDEGYRLILIGSAAHPEVRAIIGCVDNKVVVVKDQLELNTWWKGEGRRTRRVGIIAQTTIDIMLFRNMVVQLVGRVPDLRAVDTLCHSTMARQHEARRLAHSSDLVLVLGGRNSSNTESLRRICLISGTPTLQLETPEELDLEILDGVRHLAILGGASTPEWIVEGVREKILRAGAK